MFILGIDPGTATTGYGIIEVSNKAYTCVDYGCIETNKNLTLEERLAEIGNDITQIIKQYKPEISAVEELFFAKNIKTAIAVSHARGVILEKIHSQNIPIYHFTPLQVKQSLTGYGRASKEQIQTMVQTLLHLDVCPKPDDAADALAIAITCAFTNKQLKESGM